MRNQRNQLGIFATVFKRPEFEGVLNAVKKQGLHKIEFNLSCTDVLDMANTDTLPAEAYVDHSIIDNIRTVTKNNHVEMVSIAGYFNMIHPDVKLRSRGLQQLDVLMQFAGKLDIPVVSLCTGTRDMNHLWRKHKDNSQPEAYIDILESMAAALVMADKYDITVAFEPEINLVIDSPQKTREFLDDLKSPRLKVIFDSANIFPEGGFEKMDKIMTEAIELLAEDIVLVHAKDVTTENQAGDCCAGKGRLDYGLYMRLLREINYEGAILLHSLSEAEVDGCIKHVTGHMSG